MIFKTQEERNLATGIGNLKKLILFDMVGLLSKTLKKKL